MARIWPVQIESHVHATSCIVSSDATSFFYFFCGGMDCYKAVVVEGPVLTSIVLFGPTPCRNPVYSFPSFFDGGIAQVGHMSPSVMSQHMDV